MPFVKSVDKFGQELSLPVSGSVIENLVANPTTASVPGRYIVPITGTSGVFVGQEGKLADFNGESWVFTAPPVGYTAIVTTGVNSGQVWKFTTSWAQVTQTTGLATYNWVQSSAYKATDLVIYNNVWYQANGNIPANTAFTVGTAGATWRKIGGSSGATLSTLTISATTTNPTKAATREQDYIVVIDDGSGWCEVEFCYAAASNAGATSGSGTYLFSLPAGFSFDTTRHPVDALATTLDLTRVSRIIPGSTGIVSFSTSMSDAKIVPYSATRFKMVTTTAIAGASHRALATPGSAYYAMNSNQMLFQGRFLFKKL